MLAEGAEATGVGAAAMSADAAAADAVPPADAEPAANVAPEPAVAVTPRRSGIRRTSTTAGDPRLRRRIRRVAAGWLRVASVRIAPPSDSPPA